MLRKINHLISSLSPQYRDICKELEEREKQEEAQKRKDIALRQEEELENDPFLNLISDRGFMKEMDELHWEIRAEEEQTGQNFKVIMNRRLEELGFQHGTPEWDAAKEGIRNTESDVAIGYAEAQGDSKEEQWVREWEQQEIDAALPG